MKIKVFSVFDSKGAFYGQPFFDQREAPVIRALGDVVNSKSQPQRGSDAEAWINHPEDYHLYMLGEFDNETGELIPCQPKALVSFASLKEYMPHKNGSELTPVN